MTVGNTRLNERIDVYTLETENNIFGNQGYFIANNNEEALSETRFLNYLLMEDGDVRVYDGTKQYYPNAGRLIFKGHFIYGGKYIKYHSLDESNIVVYDVLPIPTTYDESWGNLKNYDNNEYVLYFGDGGVHQGIEVVSNMVYNVDWDAIHKEIEDSLPKNPGVTYHIEELEVFYVSEEYIKAVEANSQENLYFNGLTQQEMLEQYGTDWSFVYRDGKILHHTEAEAQEFDWKGFFTKVAIGVGVILIAATITAVTAGGAAPAVVSCIFATAAKLTATSLIAGAVAATVDYCLTGDINSSLDAFADGFMFTAVAVSAATLAGIIPAACFVAGTEILTNNGSIAIENISPGAVVLSYNERAQRAEYKKVKQVFEREAEELVNISIDGSLIKTTPEHPFYVVDKGWTPAKYLNAGDKLLRNDGQDVIIESVSAELLSESQKVYNFEVADNHNYYVGEIPVLVHNDCGSTATTIGEVVTGGALNDLQIALGIGVCGVVVGGAIVGGLIDGGILELPKSINVENNFEKLKEKVKEAVLSRKKEYPDRDIVIRFGDYTISNFLPRKPEDTSTGKDEKRGLSVLLVTETALLDGSFWKGYMQNYTSFNLAFLDSLNNLCDTLPILFECYPFGSHIAIRPKETPIPVPNKQYGKRELLEKMGEIKLYLDNKYGEDYESMELETNVGDEQKNTLLKCAKSIKSLFVPCTIE